VGQVLGVIVEVLVGALTFAIDVVTSAIEAFKVGWEALTPVFEGVKEVFSVVWTELQKLGAALGFTSQRAGGVSGTMSTLGEVAQVVGGIIGSVAAAIAGVIAAAMRIAGRAIAVVIGIFRALVGVVEGIVDIFAGIVTGDWARVWVGFKKVVLNAINFLAQILLGFVEVVAGIIDAVASIFGADLGWADAIHGLREDIEKGLTGGVEEVTAGVEVRPRPAGEVSPAAAAALPSVSAAEAELAALERTAAAPPVRVEAPPTTTTVNLVVDGEVLARAVARAERGGAARSFVPVPAPG